MKRFLLSAAALFLSHLSSHGQASLQMRSVGTLLELLQRAPVPGQSLLVNGYRSAGDWGAPRSFIATNAIPAATNTAHFFNPGGGTNYWMSADWNSSQQDVRWFGAKGDGATDDLISLQEALNYTANGSLGTLLVPADTYAITGTLLVTNKIQIRGLGREVCVIKRTGEDTNPLVRILSTPYWSISDLTFDGSGFAPGIDTYLSAESVVERCVFRSYSGFGYRMHGVYGRLLNNRFRDAANTNAVGVLNSAPGSAWVITGNSFGSGAIGIRFDEPCNGLIISGNAFEDNTYGILIPRFVGGIYGGVQDLTIQGNFFELNPVSPMSLGWGPYSTNSYGHNAFNIGANAFAQSGNGPIYIDSIDTITVHDHRFGPPVIFGTNFTMLHLVNNTYTTNRTLNYANLGSKLLDQDGVVFVNAGDPPSIGEFKPYFLSGSLGLATPNPQTRLDVWGPIRSTYNGPLPVTGAGLELFYQESPEQSTINSYDRTGSRALPLQITASRIIGSGLNSIQWPASVTGSISNPPNSAGTLWFRTNNATSVRLMVRSPDGTDYEVGTVTSTNAFRVTVAGTNLVDNPNFLGIAGTTPGYFGVAGSNGVIFQLYLHGVDTDRINTNGAALYSLLAFDGTNWVATTNLGTITADTLIIRSNFVGTIPATNIDTAIARLASPAFTGTPTVPTATVGTSNTTAASTEFVMQNRGAGGGSGDVVGPASSVSNNLPAFGSTTGKQLKDSGIATTNVQTISGANATFVPITASMPTVMSGAGLSNQVFFGAPTIYAGSTNLLGAVNGKQPADADLDDLADGSLSGSKVGTGIDAGNITAGTLAAARVATNFPGLVATNLTAVSKLTIPQSDDPDVSAAGDLSWDTDGWLRAWDGSAQVAVGRKVVQIDVTVYKPNSLDAAQRDAMWIWSNKSGMSFIVTGWSAWSTSDNTDLTIKEVDGDGANSTTVDVVSITTDGTSLFYGSDSTITAGTIENGHMLLLDFDDTDTPSQVHITITGYYNADVN